MAFKTDTLKLKLLTSDAEADEVNGELAIVNNVLRIRTGGSWADVSSGGGGGGGAANLFDLNDVASTPADADQNDVGVINGSDELVFQKLTLDNIDSSALYSGSDFGDDNTHLMTAQAIKNKIEDYGYTTGTDFITNAQFGSAGIMATDGAGSYSVVTNNSTQWDTAYSWTQDPSNYSTVEDLNDLSDVSTPATLDAAHVGKAVGVVSSGGTASSITFDFSGVSDGTGIGGNIYFSLGEQVYWIFFDGGGNPITSDTTFTPNGPDPMSASIDGTQATTNQVAQDVRVLLENTFSDAGYSLGGINPEVVLTADAVGVASTVEYILLLSNINTTGFFVSSVPGADAAYQYELINTSGAADPNWNHVQNTAWGGNLTIATNTASNLTWVNTQDPTTNELTIRQPSDYGAYAVITVMNASNSTMDISTVDNSFDFNCQQLTPTQSNTITLEAFQKAILVRTSGTDWEVVLASI